MPDNTSPPPNIVMLPVLDLAPNPWNPNFQTPEQFTENVAEMRRCGRPHNPVTVRRLGTGYQVLNGEHTLRAAIENGFAEVPCEIVTADEFEARLQTLKRNQHGCNDPIRLGQMYRDMLGMLGDRDHSVRGLSRRIDIPEATIRGYLDYAKAAELRSARAPATCLQDLSELTHTQIKTYAKLPDAWRDLWLDDGADVELLTDLCPEPANVGAGIARSGLEHVIEADLFRGSVQFAWRLAVARSGHHRVDNIDEYIAPLTEIRLGQIRQFAPPETLDLLPCRVHEGNVDVLISAADWANILRGAASRTTTPKRLYTLVQDGVLSHLRKAGINPADVYGPQVGEALRHLDEGPDFIRTASFLSLDERVRLLMAEADAPMELVSQAKRMTVEHLRQTQTGADGENPEHKKGDSPGRSVVAVFERCVAQLLGAQRVAADDELFGDPDRLLDTVLAKLTSDKEIAEGVVGGRPAREVLAGRLRSLQPPEFSLLAAAVLRSTAPGRRWMAAVGNAVPPHKSRNDGRPSKKTRPRNK